MVVAADIEIDPVFIPTGSFIEQIILFFPALCSLQWKPWAGAKQRAKSQNLESVGFQFFNLFLRKDIL
jgi:hypothetical protein